MMELITENSNEIFKEQEIRVSKLKLKEYSAYHFKWQLYRFLGAFSASLAIIPATISYEHSYDPLRTSSTCQIIHENTFFYRSITLFLSYTGIFLELLYKHYYFMWINCYPHTFAVLPHPHKITFLEAISMIRKRSKWEYLSTKKTWLILLVYLTFPYPGITQEIRIPQQILYEAKEVCYYVEEFWYFIMFFRLFYLMLTVCAYGKFQGAIAKRICDTHRVETTASFSFRCYASTHPLLILAFLLVIPGIIVFGIGIRIFERPLITQDLDSIENSMWLVVITMTTVGYGDRVPLSVCSRIVVCMAIFWGGINLSLTFVTLGSFLKLKAKENQSYRAILANRESGIIISSFALERIIVRKNKLKGFRKFFDRIQRIMGEKEFFVASAETRIFRMNENIEKSFNQANVIADKINRKLMKLSFNLRRSRRSLLSRSSLGSISLDRSKNLDNSALGKLL